MRAIIVDDEPIMIRSFCRAAEGIPSLDLVGRFDDPEAALAYATNNEVDVAFLDIAMPKIGGLDLARRLKAHRPEMMIVFVTAYDSYIRESNEIGAEYYLMKPYKKETVEKIVERLAKLAPVKEEKPVVIHTFGRFTVFHNGKPLPLVGKTKEILAYVVCQCGNEVSNEHIYTTIWEDREVDNQHMKVYYNALTRLKKILKEAGISELLISTTRGQILNMEIVDCDYFEWLAGNRNGNRPFMGEFMSDYSWAEEILAGLMFNK